MTTADQTQREMFVTPAKPLSLSHSAATRYQVCPRQYRFSYVERLEPVATSVNLGFGSAIDEATSAFVVGHALGVDVDPIPVFDRAWQAFCNENIVEYSTKFDSSESVVAMGHEMLRRFINVWNELGYVALLDPQGKPLVQVELKTRLPGNVIFTAILDIIAMDGEGRVLIIDVKTPSDRADEAFTLNSDQLCGYQLSVEANKEKLGIDKVDGVGFLEMIKRPIPKKSGKGPEVLIPEIKEPFSAQQQEEFVAARTWIAEDIRKERFPRRALDSYNTPCSLCSFQKLCTFSDRTGLKEKSRRGYNPNQKALQAA